MIATFRVQTIFEYELRHCYWPVIGTRCANPTASHWQAVAGLKVDPCGEKQQTPAAYLPVWAHSMCHMACRDVYELQHDELMAHISLH